MLLELAQWLAKDIRAFNVFNYITLRAVLATLTALTLSFVAGPALILIAMAVTTLLWADLHNRFVWIVMVVTLGFGIIGWVDDWRKVVQRNPKGLSAKAKFFWQSLIGIVAAIYIVFSISAPNK